MSDRFLPPPKWGGWIGEAETGGDSRVTHALAMGFIATPRPALRATLPTSGEGDVIVQPLNRKFSTSPSLTT
jgi:hypothetical protein